MTSLPCALKSFHKKYFFFFFSFQIFLFPLPKDFFVKISSFHQLSFNSSFHIPSLMTREFFVFIILLYPFFLLESNFSSENSSPEIKFFILNSYAHLLRPFFFSIYFPAEKLRKNLSKPSP